MSLTNFFSVVFLLFYVSSSINGQSIPMQEIDFNSLSGMKTYELVNRINSSQQNLQKRNTKTHRLDSIGIWQRDHPFLEFRETGVFKHFYSDTLEIRFGVGLNNDCSSNKCSYRKHTLDPITSRITSIGRYSNWNGSQEQYDTLKPDFFNLLYYSQGLLSRMANFSKKGFGLSHAHTETRFIYDGKGNLAERQNLGRDSVQDTFELSRNTIYHYNANNNLESIVIYNTNFDDLWYAEDSIHITYNDQSEIINLSEYAPLSSSTWWKNYNHDYIYAQGVLDKIKIQSLLPDGTIRPVVYEQSYTYQSSGEILTESGELVEPFVDSRATHYFEYLNDDILLTENVQYPVFFIYDEDYSQWENVILSQESGQFERRQYIAGDVYDIRRVYFYSELDPNNTIEDQATTIEVNIFPNPATQMLTISVQEIEGDLNLSLFDLSGKEVLNQIISNDQTISVADYTSGIYTYKVTNSEGLNTSGKFVISK